MGVVAVSNRDDTSVDGIDRRSLLWGLERLCLWGELQGEESADPHVRAEAAASAKVTIDQIAWELRSIEPETDRLDGGES